jgi:hypothetical protein
VAVCAVAAAAAVAEAVVAAVAVELREAGAVDSIGAVAVAAGCVEHLNHVSGSAVVVFAVVIVFPSASDNRPLLSPSVNDRYVGSEKRSKVFYVLPALLFAAFFRALCV